MLPNGHVRLAIWVLYHEALELRQVIMSDQHCSACSMPVSRGADVKWTSFSGSVESDGRKVIDDFADVLDAEAIGLVRGRVLLAEAEPGPVSVRDPLCTLATRRRSIFRVVVAGSEPSMHAVRPNPELISRMHK